MEKSLRSTSLKIAVIIATCNRPELLKSRALQSIFDQTITPDYLIVSDDSESEKKKVNRSIVNSIYLSGCDVFYLENHRTTGASGCWNAAIDLVVRKLGVSSNTVLAFLDDDDSWSPRYLEVVLGAMIDYQLDMVAAGIQRIEDSHEAPIRTVAPDSLNPDLFLVGNPGIQGSNLFLKLDLFLQAGEFDESLSSATDRDLCIRIADLGNARYSAIPEYLVQHYAEPSRSRLSTKGSDAKLNGLTSFWQKYSSRMTSSQQRQFSDRASNLFGWKQPSITSGALLAQPIRAPVVLGLSSEINSTYFQALVSKLIKLKNNQLIGLDVVIFRENHNANDSDINNIKKLRKSGLGCFILMHPIPKIIKCHSNLDTLIHCCLQISRSRPGSEIWILKNTTASPFFDDINTIEILFQRLGAEKISQKTQLSESTDQIKSDYKEFSLWVNQQRIESAKFRIKSHLTTKDLKVLGCGSEAVVFTDQKFVLKCIDYWKTRIPEAQINFLKTEGSKWENIPGLYALESVKTDGPWIFIKYKYEKSMPYKGGHEDDLIQLMDGCTRARIACNNIHPKNLVITASQVKLIDYGSDIRPWSPLGFEHMARRAFLTCYHANHRDLNTLMRRSLITTNFPEMEGYQAFRKKLDFPFEIVSSPSFFDNAKPHKNFTLIVGIISSEPDVLLPLLQSLIHLEKCDSIVSLKVLLLDNHCPKTTLSPIIQQLISRRMDLTVIPPSQFESDARAGLFGYSRSIRSKAQQSISVSRTMIQRYLGLEMQKHPGSIGWLLDDDMRVDARAIEYLPWLPSFRQQGVDVLLGAYEGSSPNPPLNGLRVQLMDLIHNLQWLNSLPPNVSLPDRAAENTNTRKQFPDYYYDLSRKHSAHLEKPMWLEPVYNHETVAEARSRLITGATAILNGDPLTRGIIARPCSNPLEEASESVNRGGCTFILNADALNLTPNFIIKTNGQDARRSDMIWAIVNHYYRHMTIKAVSFPVQHIGRINIAPTIKADKVVAEIVGSALYASMTNFLKQQTDHQLNFTTQEKQAIAAQAIDSMNHRLERLQISFERIRGLTQTLSHIDKAHEFTELLQHLERGFSPTIFGKIFQSACQLNEAEIHQFLSEIIHTVDDYATNWNSTKINTQ